MEPAIVVVFLVILIGVIMVLKWCGDAFDTTSQSTANPTAPQATNDNLTEQERREERRFRILTSVVHKVSKSSLIELVSKITSFHIRGSILTHVFPSFLSRS